MCELKSSTSAYCGLTLSSALGILRTMATSLISTEVMAIANDPTLAHLWEVMCGAGETSVISAFSDLTSRLSPLCVTYLWEGSSSLVNVLLQSLYVD